MPAVQERPQALTDWHERPAGRLDTFSRSRRTVSPAFIALILFAAINLVLCLGFTREKHPTRDAGSDAYANNLWAGTGSIDITADQFNALDRRPNVVLLGSSLMMHPIYMLDRIATGTNSDIFHYHASVALERALEHAGLAQRRVFNMSTFGQMISDSYIWADQFLDGAKRPDAIVFGVAPRDFYDAQLSAPLASFTFKRLVGLRHLNRYADLFLPRPQDRLEFVADHACFFYGKRVRLQREARNAADVICTRIKLIPPAPAKKPPADIGLAMTAESRDRRWADSMREYRKRYSGIDTADLSVQFGFLDRFLDLCTARGIKVVLLNMPLTERNRTLMPPAFYQRYRHELARMTSNHKNVSLCDLGSSADFKDADYWDTAHLNQFGGRKLVDHLVPELCRLP